MKNRRIVHIAGAALALMTVVLKGFYPEMISGIIFIGLALIAIVLMVYQTKINWINVVGFIMIFILGILYELYYTEMVLFLGSFKGLLAMLLVSYMTFYERKQKGEGGQD